MVSFVLELHPSELLEDQPDGFLTVATVVLDRAAAKMCREIAIFFNTSSLWLQNASDIFLIFDPYLGRGAQVTDEYFLGIVWNHRP